MPYFIMSNTVLFDIHTIVCCGLCVMHVGFIVEMSKIVGEEDWRLKKIYLKTSQNSLHNDVAVLVRWYWAQKCFQIDPKYFQIVTA